MPLKKVKDYIRKRAKDKNFRLSPEQVTALRGVLEHSITDRELDEGEENESEE